MANNVIFSTLILTKKQYYLIIEELLACYDFYPTIWTEPEKEDATLSIYSDTIEEAQKVLSQIKEILDKSNIIKSDNYSININEIQKEDWSESWKKYFHVISGLLLWS